MENEIVGVFPIIFDGVTSGEISIMREGLFWLFDAKCLMQNDIVRLSVFGNGQEGYLGVMEPTGDILTLKKKLSRSAVKDFPQIITHGGRKGELEYLLTDNNTENLNATEFTTGIENNSPPNAYNVNNDANSSPPDTDNVNNDVDYSPPEESIPPPANCVISLNGSADLDWFPCPCPCSLFSGIKEKMICSYITGAFSTHFEDNLLLAIPESVTAGIDLTESFKFSYKTQLFDENYNVYRIKQGNSASEL